MNEPTILETHCGTQEFLPLYEGYKAKTAIKGLILASKTRCTCEPNAVPPLMCVPCISIAHAVMFLTQQTKELTVQKNVSRVRAQAITDANSRIEELRDENEALIALAQQRQESIDKLGADLFHARNGNKERKFRARMFKADARVREAELQQANLELEMARSTIDRLLKETSRDYV